MKPKECQKTNIHNEQIVFRCSKEMKQILKYNADARGMKLSDLIRNICVESVIRS